MADYIYDENGNRQENENGGAGAGNAGTPENQNENRGTPEQGYGYYGYQGNNMQNGYGYGGYGYGVPPMPPKPPKKKRGTGTVIAVVAIIVATVLLATAAGVGGYMLTKNTMADGEGTHEIGDPVDTSDETGDTPATDMPSTGVVLSPDSLGTKDKGTIAEVVKKVADSVVEITTEYAQQNGFYYTYGAGSGVIIDTNGYIITNNHVINDDEYGVANTIRVRLTNGESYEAKLVGTDADSDIAVLKIEAEGLTAAAVGTNSTLAVGEEVVIIGNPLGSLGGSVTNGIISALDREITVENETMNLMQTNAAVNPGNSGGGMFNMAGELVGIVNAKYSDTDIEGIGFAIPIDDAVSVANEILDHGYVRGRVSLHITVVEISTYQQMMQYRVNALGLYVSDPEKGYNDGALRVGDRIASVDGEEILTFAELKTVLKKHSVGDKLDAVVIRNGKSVDVVLECFEKTVADVTYDNGKSGSAS